MILRIDSSIVKLCLNFIEVLGNINDDSNIFD